jgi:hypothetical protein
MDIRVYASRYYLTASTYFNSGSVKQSEENGNCISTQITKPEMPNSKLKLADYSSGAQSSRLHRNLSTFMHILITNLSLM